MLQEVLHIALTLDMVNHSVSISACEKGRHWEETFLMLQGMVRKPLTSDVVTYSSATSACEKGEHWEETLRLLQEMLLSLIHI